MFINHKEKANYPHFVAPLNTHNITSRELSPCAVNNNNDFNVIYPDIVGVQVLLILDHERGVIQCDVNVRNVLTLSVVKACTFKPTEGQLSQPLLC